MINLAGADFNKQPDQVSASDILTTAQAIIADIIKNTGYSLGRISRETGISKATVAALANGSVRSPIYRTWNRLLYLYFASCFGLISEVCAL